MSRADALSRILAERRLDAIVVTDLLNVRYLSGFTGSNALCVVGSERRDFLTDFRYTEQAEAQVDGFDRLPAERDLLGGAVKRLSGRVGFEDQHLSVRAHARLRELAGDGVELVPAGGLVEGLRAVKDEEELRRIAAAAELADTVFDHLRERGLAERTELEVALAVERLMREGGAEGPSFDPIVAAGAHGALPHAEPRDQPIPHDALVVLDLGCRLDGYCSDCTRTLATGDPGDEAREVYELVRSTQEEALAAVRAGTACRDVDSAARDVITAAGHGERFGHGLGHGVGLEIHEEPRLSQQSDDALAAGNVVTVEPGVYLPGAFGVRIEDLVVVREGEPEILTRFPKDLIVAGE